MAIYAGVWASIASLALIACLVLGVYAQATFKWWEIKTNLPDTEYYFGLYRICRSDLSGETCYRFDKDGMTNLMNNTIGLQYKTMNILEPGRCYFSKNAILGPLIKVSEKHIGERDYSYFMENLIVHNVCVT